MTENPVMFVSAPMPRIRFISGHLSDFFIDALTITKYRINNIPKKGPVSSLIYRF